MAAAVCAQCERATLKRCSGCKRTVCSLTCQRALGCQQTRGCAQPAPAEPGTLLALPDEVLLNVLHRVFFGAQTRLVGRRLRLLWDEAHAPASNSDERPCRVTVGSWPEAANVLARLQARSTRSFCRRLVLKLERPSPYRSPFSGTFYARSTIIDTQNTAWAAKRLLPTAARAFLRCLPTFADALSQVRVDVKDEGCYAADVAMLASVVPFRDINFGLKLTAAEITLVAAQLSQPSGVACATLRSLDLSYANVDAPTAAALARLAVAPRLAKLILACTSLDAAGAAALAPLALAPALRTLILGDNETLGDAGLVALVPLTRSTQLEHLDLNSMIRSEISDVGVTALAAALAQPCAAPLRILRLCMAHVGDAGAIALSRLTTLEELNLNNNDVDDAGAAAFALHPRLRVLDLGHNYITRAGALALLRAPPLALREISLRGLVGGDNGDVQHYVEELRMHRGVEVVF